MVSAGLAVLALLPDPALAEAAAKKPPDESIIVTAQRRPERADDVPISLTAVRGDRLDRMQATDTPSLGKVVPSLVMTRSGAFTQPYLRGIGKRSTLGVENSVATYVDGVYLASSIGALLDLRGVERVEVLNGPQGTLFGRNTTGGVIQIVTKDPEPRESGEVILQAGNYGLLRGDVFVTGGSDRLAANVALSVSKHGGYGENLFTGKKSQGEVDHNIVARSKWVWRPGDLKLTLAGDYQDTDHDFSLRPLKGFPPISTPRIHGFRDGDQDAASRYHLRYGGLSLRADVPIGELNLMSLSAGRWMHAQYGQDLDVGPQSLLSAFPIADQTQFSQEFQLQSNSASRLQWAAGLYYFHFNEQYAPTNFIYAGSYSASLGGRTLQLLSDTGRVSSYAAYGQATYPIAQATNLTGGLRYTVEHRSVEARGQRTYDTAPFIRPIPGLPLLDEAPFENSDTFRELTWRASVDHHFSHDLMAYVSASRGFQSGGWNLQTPQAPPFEPEELDAYEAGMKLAAPGGRFGLDSAAFYYDYSDMQVSVFTPLGSATTNATSAKVYGLDLQANVRPDKWTTLTLGGQWLHARYDDFPNATCTDYGTLGPTRYAPISCDASGNRLPFAPKFKFNAGAVRNVFLGRSGTLVLSANLAYNSGYFSEPDNVMRQKAFATLDASVEWQPAHAGPSFRLWGLNLTGTDYFDSLSVFPTVAALYRPAPPRRVGASMIYTF